MAPNSTSTFAERLAFARLVYHYRTGKSPGNADLGRAVGRTQPWATKWAGSETPPTDFRVHAPLANYLNVEERWLFRGEGAPPMPELWARWLASRRGDERPGYKRIAEHLGAEVAAGSTERPARPERKKAVGEGRQRRKDR